MLRALALGLCTLTLSSVVTAQTSYPYAIKTLAGVEPLGNGGPAKSALFDFPVAVAVDSSGNIYVADQNGNGIRKITTAGVISAFSSIEATDLKVDSAGNIYAADGFATVYKITPAGVATAIAGGSYGFGGDNGPATAARLASPEGIAFDSQGNLYIADTDNCRVRKVTAGTITTIAGNGVCNFGPVNGPATSTPLFLPGSVAVDSSGNVYIAEDYEIRKLLPNGQMTIIAGDGAALGNGLAINAAIGYSDALAVDASGDLFIADPFFDLVREITGSNIRTVAGVAAGANPSPGFSGDGGPATSAQLFNPIGLAFDSNGLLYIADEDNQRIRRLDQSLTTISTIAGATHYGGDGGPAASAILDLPESVAMDSNGNIYFADTFNNRIRKITAAGVISTVAGTGACGYSGDNGPAVSATLCHPFGVAINSQNNLFIADSQNFVVREVTGNGLIATIAGTGDYADAGNNVPATSAMFRFPYGLAFDSAGSLYISDYAANRVRKMTLGGNITNFAGSSSSSYGGDGGLATAAAIYEPGLLATDSAGNLYIADTGNGLVRKVSGGIITTVAGTTSSHPSGATATSTAIGPPDGLAVDSAGNLYISEPALGYIAQVTPSGAITNIAGNGQFTFAGDGLALSVPLNEPAGIVFDSKGNLIFADRLSSRIRELIPDAPSGLSINSGDAQTGNAGAVLPTPLTVLASFQGGVPIPGSPVTFTLTSGQATLSATSTSIDATGVAGISVTLGNAPGPVVVTASMAGFSVQFHLTAVTPTPLPTVSTGGVDGAGGSVPAVTAISPGGLASIYGINFAPSGTSAPVQSSDLVNGVLPTNLAGTCVQVDNQPAFLTYVSPSQVNIQVPAVRVGANVPVQVITGCGSASPLSGPTITVSTLAATPEFLYWVKNASGKNPVIAVNAVTGAYVAAAGLIAGVAFTPAKPGDYLTIYGVSFGPTNPAVAPGVASPSVASTVNAPSVTLGGTPLPAADFLYAGASPGTAGLYQVNIQVPAGLADGDYPIVLNLGSFSTPVGGYLTVKN
jgi:uncharacterized protein (TIGR03437 family)